MKKTILGLLAFAAIAFVVSGAIAEGVKCGQAGPDATPAGCCAKGKDSCQMMAMNTECNMAKDGSGKMGSMCCDKCGKACTPDNKCCDKCCCAVKDSCGKMDSKTCEKCGKECTCAQGKKCCDECCRAVMDGKEGCCKKSGCSKTGTSRDATSQDVVVDPVCGMDVPSAGSKYNYEYKGKTYNFCNESCMEKFKKDPSKYIGK